jgi:uncharacterized membrane protein
MKHTWFINPYKRLGLAAGIGVMAGMASSFLLPFDTAWIVGWDAFALTLVISSVIIFNNLEMKHIQTLAIQEDSSATIRFLTLLTGACASLAAIIFLQSKHNQEADIHLPVSILAVVLSWVVIHVMFTFRYAHQYYDYEKHKADQIARGIDFPNDKEPTYWDFAYFAFTVGMTAQVSDTPVQSKRIRKLVLLHSLISFAYNTIIIALTISIVSGLFEN